MHIQWLLKLKGFEVSRIIYVPTILRRFSFTTLKNCFIQMGQQYISNKHQRCCSKYCLAICYIPVWSCISAMNSWIFFTYQYLISAMNLWASQQHVDHKSLLISLLSKPHAILIIPSECKGERWLGFHSSGDDRASLIVR